VSTGTFSKPPCSGLRFSRANDLQAEASFFQQRIVLR
jgi:hypothetical protein